MKFLNFYNIFKNQKVINENAKEKKIDKSLSEFRKLHNSRKKMAQPQPPIEIPQPPIEITQPPIEITQQPIKMPHPPIEMTRQLQRPQQLTIEPQKQDHLQLQTFTFCIVIIVLIFLLFLIVFVYTFLEFFSEIISKMKFNLNFKDTF